jgi:hypothetical protein
MHSGSLQFQHPVAPYGMPTFGFAGNTVGISLNASSLDVPYPDTVANNDLALIQVAVAATSGGLTINAPSGWTEVSHQNGIGSQTNWRHAVFWKRLDGTETGSVAVPLSSNPATWVSAVMSTWQGALTSGTPIENVSATTPVSPYSQSGNPTMVPMLTGGPDRHVVNLFVSNFRTFTTIDQGFAQRWATTNTSMPIITGHSKQINTPRWVYEVSKIQFFESWGVISLAIKPDQPASSSTPYAQDPILSAVRLLSGYETAVSDESSFTHAITKVGNADRSNLKSKFGTYSAAFDGTGDYLTISDADFFRWDGTANSASANRRMFTVECFINLNSKTDNQTIISRKDSASDYGDWALLIVGGKLTFRYWSSPGAYYQIQYTWTPTLNTWYHIAYDLDHNLIPRLYIDGVMVVKGTTSNSTTDQQISYPVVIGSYGAGTNSPSPLSSGAVQFNGNIDELRYTATYARYATDAGFTIPSSAYPRT